jgi:hypothetical protein
MITYALVKGKQEVISKNKAAKAGTTRKRGRMLLPENPPRPALVLGATVAENVMSVATYKAITHMDGITRYYCGGKPVDWTEYYLRTNPPAMSCYMRDGD